MQNNKKRATVIFTKDISETRLKEFQHQYNKIPKIGYGGFVRMNGN